MVVLYGFINSWKQSLFLFIGLSSRQAFLFEYGLKKIKFKTYHKKILSDKIEDLHKLAKALLPYETMTGQEIEYIVNKNLYPKNKEDLKVEEDDQSSALGSMGLKPKIVH